MDTTQIEPIATLDAPPSIKQRFIDRGHRIITDTMAGAKMAEKTGPSRSTSISTALEHCLRQLWSLMSAGPQDSAAEEDAARQVAEDAANAEEQARLDAAALKEVSTPTADSPAYLTADQRVNAAAPALPPLTYSSDPVAPAP